MAGKGLFMKSRICPVYCLFLLLLICGSRIGLLFAISALLNQGYALGLNSLVGLHFAGYVEVIGNYHECTDNPDNWFCQADSQISQWWNQECNHSKFTEQFHKTCQQWYHFVVHSLQCRTKYQEEYQYKIKWYIDSDIHGSR